MKWYKRKHGGESGGSGSSESGSVENKSDGSGSGGSQSGGRGSRNNRKTAALTFPVVSSQLRSICDVLKLSK